MPAVKPHPQTTSLVESFFRRVDFFSTDLDVYSNWRRILNLSLVKFTNDFNLLENGKAIIIRSKPEIKLSCQIDVAPGYGGSDILTFIIDSPTRTNRVFVLTDLNRKGTKILNYATNNYCDFPADGKEQVQMVKDIIKQAGYLDRLR